MSLPIVDTPKYDLIIPSSKKKIVFRPYKVREQAMLLLAGETKDIKTITKATKEVIAACIVAPVNFDVDSLTNFDIEYFFVNLRAKSVGELIELQYTCENLITKDIGGEDIEGVCKTLNIFEVDLRKVQVVFPEGHKEEIVFNNKLGIKMGYPSLEGYQILQESKTNNYEKIIELTCADAKYVFDEKKIYSEFSKEEMKEFILNLGPLDMDKLIQFYSSMPYISTTIPFKCRSCGYKTDIVLKGLEDFFG